MGLHGDLCTYIHRGGEVTKDLLDTVQIGELQLLLEDYPAVVRDRLYRSNNLGRTRDTSSQ